jgi:hypothetical protein
MEEDQNDDQYHPPAFSLASSMNIGAYEQEELENRILEEDVKSVEELPLEIEGEREEEVEERHGDGHVYFSDDEGAVESRKHSQAPSRVTSRAPSRHASRAPSRTQSRAPSRAPSHMDLYALAEGEYGTEETHGPEDEERETKEERNKSDTDPVELVRVRSHGTGTELVKVKSHASNIVEFFTDPVERESRRKIIHKTLEDPLYSRIVSINNLKNLEDLILIIT